MYRVENISAGYGKNNIINNISFEVASSALCALLGVNGSGKSTLLKSLACQLKHSGQSYIHNQCIEDLSIRQKAMLLSYLPQKSGIQISLPVLDVVLMGFNPVLKILEKPTKQQKQKAIDALKLVGLESYINKDFLCLSEGQKQLVLLARLMIEETKVLLLDEIDSALDFHNRYEVMKHLKTYITKQNASAVLCLHDLSLALRFADQLIIIHEGCISDIIYPKKDSIEKIQNALSKIYKNIKIIKHNVNKDVFYLTYWEDEL